MKVVREGGYSGFWKEKTPFRKKPRRGKRSTGGSSSFGRAIAFQAIGGGFEPRLPLNKSGETENTKPRFQRERVLKRGCE